MVVAWRIQTSLATLLSMLTPAIAWMGTNSSLGDNVENPINLRRRPMEIIHKHNPVREQKQLESIERAAAVAMCQASKGYDCWRYATAPRGGADLACQGTLSQCYVFQ